MKQCANCNNFFSESEFPFKDKKTGRRAKLCRSCYNAGQQELRKKYPERYKEYSKKGNEKAKRNPEYAQKQREVGKRSYLKHREERLEQQKIYREQNREIVNQRIKEWAKKHPEKRKEYAKRFQSTPEYKKYLAKYRRENIDKVRQQQRDSVRRRRANNPEKVRQYDREYRQRENARITDKAGSQQKRARKKQAPGSFTAQDIKNKYISQQGLCYWCNDSIEGDYHIDHYIPLSRGGSNFPDNIVLSCPSCNIRRHNKLPDETVEYFNNHSLR